MSARWISGRLAREWLAAALGVAALGVGVWVWWGAGGRGTYTLTVTAGSAEGVRHQIAGHLMRGARRGGVRLVVVPTAGSEEALGRVDAGKLDLALVQGGLDTAGWSHVRQVASLTIEPLHLVVRGEIAVEGRGLEFLRGKRVNVGEAGSGTQKLAREVLAFAGLSRDGGDYRETRLGYREIVEEKDGGRLPDAVFTVSALPSPVVRHLVRRWGYRIAPLRFGEAFALEPVHGESGVDRARVYATEIPAYTYGVSPPVPAEAMPTFGTRLLLVANETVPAEAVSRLLDTAYANGPGGAVLDPALADLAPELDWHAGTIAYRERVKPVYLGDAVDFLEKGTSLTGGVLGGCFFLWQWYRQRRRRRRDLGFESYMIKVSEIERKAMELETGANLPLKELLPLQLAISRLKAEALGKFAEGTLGGEELMSGFVAQVNDARDYLTRLILHERENVEQQAAREDRTAEAVWYEAVGGSDGRPVSGSLRGGSATRTEDEAMGP